ncbi:hypothetical protein F7734_55040 [Scytonema sp. UIC 10036]|uniref:hypothetical protein n=1 Tax=Scytonema sp. UIC 10036 TaxID=2304196 RepID=UPI0012DABEF1|nr:hypothetical protein [Scytonema sp. UIC 10036]MUH00906.1 hypothetical protein [Scytonema sp. UIC 10036]
MLEQKGSSRVGIALQKPVVVGFNPTYGNLINQIKLMHLSRSLKFIQEKLMFFLNKNIRLEL